MRHLSILPVLLLMVVSITGCHQQDDQNSSAPTAHPSISQKSAEDILLRASGACLAKITRLEELNEMPSDGDHFVKAWLEPIEQTGFVPEFLYLVIQYGGMRPVEDLEKLAKRKMVLHHDTLKVGEKHWFVFSDDYDASRYPLHVKSWWKYDSGKVPRDVIAAIEEDRFRHNPHWDKTLNMIYSASQTQNSIDVLVREADSLASDAMIFQANVPGTLRKISIAHHNGTYELDWPTDEEMHLVMLHTVGTLEVDNQFDLRPGSYRINYAFDIRSGQKIAQWVAGNQEIWMLRAFQQYDLQTGKLFLDMKFDFLDSGGKTAGGDTENWYRRVVHKYSSGRVASTQTYRHEHIKNGQEPVFSGSGWILIDENSNQESVQ